MKRTLLFQNPAYIRLKHNQIKVIDPKLNTELASVPCEDIGFVILEHPQITISLQAIRKLEEHKVAIISCDETHTPQALMLPFSGHVEMQACLRTQVECSQPLKKNLWKQTVEAKIGNQQAVLERLSKPYGQMDDYLVEVQSGDKTNREGLAAKFYWKHLWQDFNRDRFGDMPNALLNYGYAILRSAMARALVGSGLNPSIGIHHKSKYNAFCLADDIMEPYRPFVDLEVYRIYQETNDIQELTVEVKQKLLSIYTHGLRFESGEQVLLNGLRTTSSSLVKCLAGKTRKINYPKL
ncbi:MAG: type II CRISPR-associated endonuclease Cas1 [Flavobacteriales bacterium]